MHRHQKFELFAHYILDIYKENAMKIFRMAVETNPEAFPLLERKNIAIYSVTFNRNYFPNDVTQVFFVHEKNAQLKFIELEITDDEYYENYFAKEEDVLAMYLNIDRNNIIQNFSMRDVHLEYIPDRMDTFKEIYLNATKSWLQKSARSFQEHIKKPVSYYAKNASKYSYSLLDLQPLIEKVNDEDFSYQLEEAIAAYDNSLYLASCATLGVCLETLCKILLKKNKVKIKDSDGTMLDKLAEMLRSHQIISYKFSSRINVCYKVRNMASHTSPGKVVQNDCHFIINTLHEIIDTYY
jgi:hypothetical protein